MMFCPVMHVKGLCGLDLPSIDAVEPHKSAKDRIKQICVFFETYGILKKPENIGTVKGFIIALPTSDMRFTRLD